MGTWTMDGTDAGFWWIFPVLGILLCIFFVAILVRTFASGGHFMCMGPHQHESDEINRLRRDVEKLPIN